MDVSPVVLGRACGNCTLCCKVMSITALNKPQGRWCSHCKPGHGCAIYDERPQECAAFHCGYLRWEALGEHWLPTRSRMVVTAELDGQRIAVQVDPGFPSAWRQEPYFSEIKEMARAAASSMAQVVVMIIRRAIVIFPDREVDLGIVTDEDRIITAERKTAGGVVLEALKLRYDDPRLAGMTTGVPYARS